MKTTTKNDPAIDQIREIRHQISAEFDHDPRRVLAHYAEFEENLDAQRLAQKLSVKSNKTVIALAARGFDLSLAKSLSSRGETLASLKSKPRDKLQELGIQDWLINKIHREGRPPIPGDTVRQLLLESERTCCLCKDPSRSVVIHHIEEWSSSRSHAEENLVVLCLTHHDEAHMKKMLSLNLTAEDIRLEKSAWLKIVSERNSAAALRNTSPLGFATWDYFNHKRLLEVAQDSGVAIDLLAEYQAALRQRLIYESGEPRWHSIATATSFMYQTGPATGSHLAYYFYKMVLEKVLMAVRLISLDGNWTASGARVVAAPGKLALCKGAFYFKRLHKMKEAGNGQMRKGLRRHGKIRLSFLFDAWEATSASAYYSHLSGRTQMSGIFRVHDVTSEAGIVNINCTCLALGTGFGPERLPLTPYEGLLDYSDFEESESGGLDGEESLALDG
jgi:hypothetical protein